MIVIQLEDSNDAARIVGALLHSVSLGDPPAPEEVGDFLRLAEQIGDGLDQLPRPTGGD